MVAMTTDNHVVAAVPASAVAGFAATICSCPAENVKTVMQAETTKSTGRSVVSTIMWMGKEHGLRVFWRGWIPLYVKLGPHTLLVFLVTEQFRVVMGVESAT